MKPFASAECRAFVAGGPNKGSGAGFSNSLGRRTDPEQPQFHQFRRLHYDLERCTMRSEFFYMSLCFASGVAAWLLAGMPGVVCAIGGLIVGNLDRLVSKN